MQQKFSTKLLVFGVTVDVEVNFLEASITVKTLNGDYVLDLTESVLNGLLEHTQNAVELEFSGHGTLARVNPSDPRDGDVRTSPDGQYIFAASEWRPLFPTRAFS